MLTSTLPLHPPCCSYTCCITCPPPPHTHTRCPVALCHTLHTELPVPALTVCLSPHTPNTHTVSLPAVHVSTQTPNTHRNKDFATLASVDYLSDPSHCPSHPPHHGPTRSLLLAEGKHPDDYTPTFFIEAAGTCTAVSVVGGLLLGLGSLLLVQKRPHACVGAAVGLQVRGEVWLRGWGMGWLRA
jgi:hypothetical protein